MSPAPASRPRRCLVAEDQALIGMLLEDALIEGGFEVIGPLATCAQALAWLETDTPDLALVDYQLADGPCLELARELKRRGVPFAILSGFDAGAPRSEPAFAAVPWLEKPMSQEALYGVVRGLTAHS